MKTDKDIDHNIDYHTTVVSLDDVINFYVQHLEIEGATIEDCEKFVDVAQNKVVLIMSLSPTQDSTDQ